MRTSAWLSRLTQQLEGWHVWTSCGKWYAVPAPKPHSVPIDPRPGWYTHLPNRVGPEPTPQALRDVCRLRYGWNDYCETCGILARKCGHRQPERDGRGEAP
jgi:hypothetical protein